MTQLLPSIRSTHMRFSHLQSVTVTSSFHGIEVHTKCWRRATRSKSSRIWLMVKELRRTYTTYDPSIMTLPRHLHWQSLSRTSKSSLWNQSTDIVEFKVRWARFGESCDSWEPYKALLHVDKLHDYLRTNAMKTLIPSEHK